ncbi:helix-turn-helix domain-containing protein [Pseudanabaena sp. 'Roaring Creek']|uniref:helix-turn-helix domain-containing protein n=1 Tax=Pseudanabaena sp. 'Roaring Creek' TaxID=1681830 RepID=UPI0018D1837A|nr:helix-turn-helix domain-containing protein [Pseudanabaena sp. 'Roaring Creek']
MNITTSKQAEKLAEIGAQFKRVREDKELSIPHLTATTLISERYLRAIEDGEMESLPEPVYVRGFIRKYGTALGVGDLSEEFPLNPVLPEQKWAGSAAAELRPLHLYALYVGVIAGAVSLLATFMNSPDANKINDSQTNFSNAAQLGNSRSKLVEPTESLLPKIGGLEILKQGVTDPTAMASPLNLNLPVVSSVPNSKVPTLAKDNLGKPAANVAVETSSRLNNLLMSWTMGSGITSDNNSSNNAKIGANGDFTFVGNKPVNVGLVMQGESWMRVTVDGKTEFEGVLNEGKKVAWSGDRLISIRVGNASSVALSYNNQPIKVLGKEGEVAERQFGINQTNNDLKNDLKPSESRLRGIINLVSNTNSAN